MKELLAIKKWKQEMYSLIEDKQTKDHSEKEGYIICKGCNNGIYKHSGCNAMRCRCGYKFCFTCGAKNKNCKHGGSFD